MVQVEFGGTAETVVMLAVTVVVEPLMALCIVVETVRKVNKRKVGAGKKKSDTRFI